MMDEKYLKEAIKESKVNQKNNFTEGGPFGAVIVKEDKIIARGHNTVVLDNDPTAHAEINTIRKAALQLGTHDLSDCVLYVNAEPCPMCLSAIIWSNIKEVYYVNTAKEAGEIGFRDDFIYEFIKSGKKDKNILDITHYKMEGAKEVFEEFKNNSNKIIY